ncbi:hypothetical protein V501_07271 [Pseudogymnoascus sp. VKM F-4519 (FW-2642)]|nr:hypothetical protein V501_07271 [Pseudogymnoascus sp. VKM F-4519 (FW-2642)]
MRQPSACLTCRRRCRFSNGPNSSCEYCASKRLKCTGFQPTSAPSAGASIRSLDEASGGAHSGNGEIVQSKSAVGLPPLEVCSELVSLYFDYIHDQFHSLFHRPSLETDLANGKVPLVILYAIIGLAARSENQKQSASVLLGTISNAEGQADSGSIYYAIAVRIAAIMDLANRPATCWVEKEVNIRVWWTLYMTDTWSSYGLRLPKQMHRIKSLPLPADDEAFLQARCGNEIAPNLDTELESSLLSQMVKLHFILIEVNDFNSYTVTSQITEAETVTMVTKLSQKLDDWHTSLPPCMRDTPENLSRYAAQGFGRMFVAVYLGYYNYGQLLFYQFLNSDHYSPYVQSQLYAAKCESYATRLCEIVYAANAIPECEVHYMMAGHVLAIASTVQIHTLLFADNEEKIQAAKYRLERNFEILMRLKRFWPTLDISFARFQEFHRSIVDYTAMLTQKHSLHTPLKAYETRNFRRRGIHANTTFSISLSGTPTITPFTPTLIRTTLTHPYTPSAESQHKPYTHQPHTSSPPPSPPP